MNESINKWVACTITIASVAACGAEDEPRSLSPRGLERREAVLLVGSQPRITCEAIGADCIFDGDIALRDSQLGDLEDEQTSDTGEPTARASSELLSSSGTAFLWPRGVVPYVIEVSPTLRDKIYQAIDHWHARTPVRFVARSTETDYVAFVPSEAGFAWANVGRRGGRQLIALVERNRVGVIAHEMGHTLGFWHEHTRPDRDQHVTIHWANIRPGVEGNFATFATGNALGPYDIDSIMHYPSYEFSANGWPTITRKDGSTYPAAYTAISPGDAAAVARLYGTAR